MNRVRCPGCHQSFDVADQLDPERWLDLHTVKVCASPSPVIRARLDAELIAQAKAGGRVIDRSTGRAAVDR